VHQHQIDVVDAQSLQTCLVRLTNAIDAMPPPVELRCNKDLGPVDAGVSDGLSDSFFVAVVLGCIDQAIAGLEGCADLAYRVGADKW
jgi:hypothetical protein